MTNFKELLIGFIMVGLFIVALISFTYNITSENSLNSSLLKEPRLNKTFTKMNETLSDFYTTSNSQLSSNQNETISGGAFGLISYAIIGSVRTFTGTIVTTYYVITTLISSTIGIPNIVLNIIMALIGIALIFSAWRIYRQGQ